MGVPHSWMVYFGENPNLKWMRTGGSPISSTQVAQHLSDSGRRAKKSYSYRRCTKTKHMKRRRMACPDAPCMVYLPIFGYIWVIFGVNVDKYSIHGASGIDVHRK